jgi:hypothetical protein
MNVRPNRRSFNKSAINSESNCALNENCYWKTSEPANDWMKQLLGKVAVQNINSKIFYGLCIEVVLPTKYTALNTYEH